MSAGANERSRWPTVLLIASLVVVLAVVGVVTLATHVMGPMLFTHFERFPALQSVPKRSRNARNIEGDPINVAIVAGSDSELVVAFQRAGWVEAQPVTRASSIGIAKSVLLGRPDSTAPVSPLYLFGRQQDHAFEREAGKSARRRHHVRLWRADGIAYEGGPCGSAERRSTPAPASVAEGCIRPIISIRTSIRSAIEWRRISRE